MPFRIRIATPHDAEELLAIYAPFVTDTTVSFETEVPGIAEFRDRIEEHLRETTHLVLEDLDKGCIAGFAYNSSFREREAYRWASETSIYLDGPYQARGLGGVLLAALEGLMRAQGIRMSEACITSDNSASIAFHEHHGYRICGEHTTCGYKMGQWLSVTWMEKQLLPLDAVPEAPHPPAPEDVERIVREANEQLAGL
ncbi:GNAT family N-acetyltransferase [Collinsella sp. An2]|uniref:GNAT family N-acetyltransferase n=1 Tax=Collinsella sp. An2 TaxID=1965585 RepID=UPI000B39046B|nr:GNAT family N-acetyltransferase [Collinsella sp. An2]OUP10465.1 GNAT family N-acetyltransferase [Collinsella sp. An2]